MGATMGVWGAVDQFSGKDPLSFVESEPKQGQQSQAVL